MAFNRYNKSGRGGGFRSGGFKEGGFKSGGFRGRDSSERPQMHEAVCDNCGKNCEVPFKPTSGKPIFCSNCFEKNRGSEGERSGGRNFERSTNFEDRPMFQAVCDNCKNACKVPFQPRGDKPIYCSSCFENKDNNITRRGDQSQPNYKEQFEALNTKLDKILKLLSPDSTENQVEKEIKEAPKKTKASKKTASPAVIS